MNKTLILIFIFSQLLSFGQEKEITETSEEKKPITVTESAPIFHGCDEIDQSNSVNCFKQKMAEHVIKNMRYPTVAKQKKIQGRILVTFLINYEGVVENIIAKSPEDCKDCEILEKEAIRIISLLPKFKPGMQKGKPVKVKYTQPITFKL